MARTTVKLLGPPGTGKTSRLAARVQATIRERGSDAVRIASFTRAAAAEIGSRGIFTPPANIGTLHSFAFRAIGNPELYEKHAQDWNDSHPLGYAIGTGRVPRDDLDAQAGGYSGRDDDSGGDALMDKLDVLRARMIPPAGWPPSVQKFEVEWSQWKRETGFVDYTDMLEQAIIQVPVMPGNPEVLIVDEAQDLTKLEMTLVHQWARHCDVLVLAADDDQAIMGFRGGSAEVILEPIEGETKDVLSQSWRVPRTVHTAATAWVDQLKHREVKEYAPRDAEGTARSTTWRYNAPAPVINDVGEFLAATEGELNSRGEPKTYLILASCKYMLRPVMHALRAAGIPFHNPWATDSGEWNPLRRSRKTVSSAERLAAYLALDDAPWTGADVQRWASVVKATGVFKRGAAARIAGLPGRELTFAEVADLFDSQEELEAAVEPSLEWFESRLKPPAKVPMAFPIAVTRRSGLGALTETPRVIVSTVHSSKGGEADRVLLFPDLSTPGAREWQANGPGHDGIVRLFYVGMTRARDDLIVGAKSTRNGIAGYRLLAGLR